MKRFIQLYNDLDETKSSNTKVSLLADYFREAEPRDAIWVVYFLSGQRFKRFLSAKKLRSWVRQKYSIPKWLFSEAMVAVGDTGETLSLLVDTLREDPPKKLPERPLYQWIEEIQQLNQMTESAQQLRIEQWWDQLDQPAIFLLHKLITGAFRVGVSHQTVARGLAEAFGLERVTILHRMMGKWEPTAEFFEQLVSVDETDTRLSIPYPFFLASPLETELEELGPVDEWYLEWKWDGIRAQLIKREDEIFLWSRGEELINRSFPELLEVMKSYPNGTVIDGEIIAYFQGQPLAFSVLQQRIGRLDVTEEIRSKAPVILMVYDLLEVDGQDIRELPQDERRLRLKQLMRDAPGFLLSPILDVTDWKEARVKRAQARDHQSEGLMLKRRSAPYQVGRKRGDWYKYKVDPLSIDVVLIYAQSGSGRRANLFTAYTFAVWSDDHTELIPVGRAYSGLTDEEIKELDAWIRSNTQQRFGPVRSVDPVQVFELGFDGIMTNEKAKSGLSLRFPRMLRWRHDKPVEEIDTISTVRTLLKFEGLTEVKRNRSLDEFF